MAMLLWSSVLFELAFLPLHCTLYAGAHWLELTNKFRAVGRLLWR